MRDKIKSIINELELVIDEKNLNVSDDTLFIQACTFYRGVLANNNKSFSKKKVSELATSKQLDYLSRNNIDHNAETITKQEAFMLIKEHKEK